MVRVLFAGKGWVVLKWQEGHGSISAGLCGEAASFSYHQERQFETIISRLAEVDGVYVEDSLRRSGHNVRWLPSVRVPAEFPVTAGEMKQYDAILLSDCNAATLRRVVGLEESAGVDRLEAIRQYVLDGGGLLMFGGYASFAGNSNLGGFARTPLADVLPVVISDHDDLVTTSEGLAPEVVKPDHPILAGIATVWPPLGGHNKFDVKSGAVQLMRSGGDPILAVWEVGKGRAAAFASDAAPWWATEEFLSWRYYDAFWSNLARWLGHDL
jgi:uncharacterized membrane protein